MKCLDCGNREYELAYHGGYWLCRDCDDELSLKSYEKIEAMEADRVRLMEALRAILRETNFISLATARAYVREVLKETTNCHGPQPCGHRGCQRCEGVRDDTT